MPQDRALSAPPPALPFPLVRQQLIPMPRPLPSLLCPHTPFMGDFEASGPIRAQPPATEPALGQLKWSLSCRDMGLWTAKGQHS